MSEPVRARFPIPRPRLRQRPDARRAIPSRNGDEAAAEELYYPPVRRARIRRVVADRCSSAFAAHAFDPPDDNRGSPCSACCTNRCGPSSNDVPARRGTRGGLAVRARGEQGARPDRVPPCRAPDVQPHPRPPRLRRRKRYSPRTSPRSLCFPPDRRGVSHRVGRNGPGDCRAAE